MKSKAMAVFSFLGFTCCFFLFLFFGSQARREDQRGPGRERETESESLTLSFGGALALFLPPMSMGGRSIAYAAMAASAPLKSAGSGRVASSFLASRVGSSPRARACRVSKCRWMDGLFTKVGSQSSSSWRNQKQTSW